MKYNSILRVAFLILPVMVLASCASTHPNEKLLIGKWRTVKVERVNDASTQPAAATSATPAETQKPAQGKKTDPAAGTATTAGQGQASKNQEKLNRLIRAEEKAFLVIDSAHFATKQYQGILIRGTWKMKSSGKVVIAKNLDNKERVRMEIEELTDNHAIIIQQLPVGALRITYVKDN